MHTKIWYSYDGALERKVKEYKIIPYRILPEDKYRVGKWYYIGYDNLLIKVTDVVYDQKRLDYIIYRTNDGLRGTLTNPLTFGEDYIIKWDQNEVYKVDDIVNTDISYTGAEIAYWFFMNDIDIHNQKYKDFWGYVDTFSKHRIDDKKRYCLKAAKYNPEKYTRCRIVADEKEMLRIQKETYEKYHEIDDEFMRLQKEKDMRRVRELHEQKINNSGGD